MTIEPEDTGYLPLPPLVSIIVTHMNYSGHVEDALKSILKQSYDRWECVVVDDRSSDEHRSRLDQIVRKLGSPQVKVLWLDENLGQVTAFFAGLAATSGPFVTAIDPDDRYSRTFIEDCVRAHLNPVIYCPIVATEQSLMSPDGQITGTYRGFHRRHLDNEGGVVVIPETIVPRLSWIPAGNNGWHWTTTSAMMFRRSALDYLRPHKPPSYKRSLDAYLAPGAHSLGGTLSLTKPLVYRMIHSQNSFITDRILSGDQYKQKESGEQRREEAYSDVIDAIVANGGVNILQEATALQTQSFVQPKPPSPRSLSKRIKRSIRRRLRATWKWA